MVQSKMIPNEIVLIEDGSFRNVQIVSTFRGTGTAAFRIALRSAYRDRRGVSPPDKPLAHATFCSCISKTV